MKIEHLPLVLPVIGAGAMAALIWKWRFFGLPLTEGSYLWGIVLLSPFAFPYVMTLQGAQPGRRFRLFLGVCFSGLLGLPPAILLLGEVNSEYLLPLFPIYLWPVVAVITLIGIVGDAYIHAKRNRGHTTSNPAVHTDANLPPK